jgi:predicted DsbA family dithiol-disulfide isomerase
MEEHRMSDVTIYSDFNCPFCYATHERLAALGLHEQVRWRGVQHSPELPLPMRPAEGPFKAELAEEVESIRRRAPEVPIEVPPGKPNTGPAIELAAAASGDVADDLVLGLYRRFWRDGEDLSDPDVLAAAAAVAGEAGDRDGTALAREWQREWSRLGVGGVPLLVAEDGRYLYGLKDAEEIARFVADTPG